MLIATDFLQLERGIYAVPAPNTVLHEMVTGEPISVQIDGRVVSVPKPRLPIVEIDERGHRRKVVLMGPPWSLLNQCLRPDLYPNARRQLEQWLLAAARRSLLAADSMVFPGVMSYALGVPVVPRGEVWIGMRGLNINPLSEGFAIRWPIASSNPLEVRIKKVDAFGIYMNDEDLVIGRQGDSDGDLVFVVWMSGEPAERVELGLQLQDIVDLSASVEIPDSVEQMDPDSLAVGHAARSLVGLATWYAWVDARWGYDEIGEQAWRDAYDRYTPAIEAMMDGRKTGQAVSLEEFGFGRGLPELPTLLNMALPGVRQMVGARSRNPDFTIPWRKLVRDYWSLRWRREGVDVDV